MPTTRQGNFESITLGGIPLLAASVTLTDAQIKALPTTAIQVVAAPGSGLRIQPLKIMYDVNTAAGAYTGIADSAQFELVLGTLGFGELLFDSIVEGGVTVLTQLLGVASRNFVALDVAYKDISPEWGLVNYPLATASYENQALNVKMQGTSNLTGGNAANALKVTVLYLRIATI